MESFEILCVTMNQNDFSKIKDMNIHSDVVFANQCDHTSYEEYEFENCKAKMISTQTKGVGINRNLTLMYANADICLFADDDVIYYNDFKEVILSEFEQHLDADVMIFHFDTDSERKQIKYNKTAKCGKFSRMPWGGIRIAFRLNSVKKANVFFTTLFGGGCVFPSGEDSMWLADAKRKGLTIYVSKETIGKVSFDKSTWFTGYDEKFFFGKGALCFALHSKSFLLWELYYLWRYRKFGNLSASDKLKWMECGKRGYKQLIPYSDMVKNNADNYSFRRSKLAQRRR